MFIYANGTNCATLSLRHWHTPSRRDHICGLIPLGAGRSDYGRIFRRFWHPKSRNNS
jgi:hypothetical protein